MFEHKEACKKGRNILRVLSLVADVLLVGGQTLAAKPSMMPNIVLQLVNKKKKKSL